MGNIFRSGNKHGCAPMLICAYTIFASALLPSDVSASEKLEELAQRVGVRIIAEATSDRDVLAKCKAQIPYSRMSPRSRQRASHIITNLSQYRRMPSLQYEVNSGIYQYLVNHPDVAISTWRVMGISKLQMFQTGEFEYEASADDGSKGIADILWRDGNQCLFIVQGKYSSPMLPSAIEASALVWLRYRFVNAGDGRVMVNQQVETFISFPSQAVDTLAKLATMVTNSILDRNVFEVSLYARMMSTAAAKEPEWIAQLAERMDGVLPQRSVELVRVSRGQNPVLSSVSPPAGNAVGRKTAGLPRSGAFHAFENSMSQVKSHVPLTTSESSPALRAANDAVANAAAAAAGGRGGSNEITELPGLAYSEDHGASSLASQKAVMGGIPISPSAPLKSSTNRPTAKQSASSKTVSITKVVPAEGSAQMLSADAIAMPPVPPSGTK